MSSKRSIGVVVLGLLAAVLGLGNQAGAELFYAPFGPGGSLNAYQVVRSSQTWAAAQADAQSRVDPLFGTSTPGNLIAVDSSLENQAAQFATRYSGSYWIGGTDQAVEGEWRWIGSGVQFWQGAAGGTPVGGNYANWNGGEPNNSGGENYAEMQSSSGGWNDLNASATREYIVEYNTGVTSLPATTGPLYLNPANGRYYERTTTDATWVDSKAYAETRTFLGAQGRLAEINNKAETVFLGSLGGGWIGLTDDDFYGGQEYGNTSGQPEPPAGDRGRGFVWSGPLNIALGGYESKSLQSTGFTYWNGGEPNDSGNEDYIEIGGNGGWNDLNGSATRRAYVEYETAAVASLNLRVKTVTSTGGAGDIGSARNILNGISTQTATYWGQLCRRELQRPGRGRQQSVRRRCPLPRRHQRRRRQLCGEGLRAVVIPAAGTYSFGISHDDQVELVLDRGSDAAAVLSTPDCCSNYVAAVDFAQPGVYNFTLVHGEGGGGASVDLSAAAGSKSAFDGDFRLVGDIQNGGLATAQAKNIGMVKGFSVRDVKAAGGVDLYDLQQGLNLLNGSLPSVGETTASFPRVNLKDDVEGSAGNFGLEQAFPNGVVGAADDQFAVRATGKLVVNWGDQGWWTLGVNSDDGFRLGIDGVDFTSFAGAGGTSITPDGELQYFDPRGNSDSLGHIYLGPGVYDLTLDFFERGGGANVELYYARGIQNGFNTSFELLDTIGVPEPGALTLLALGGLGIVLLGARRLRKRAQPA